MKIITPSTFNFNGRSLGRMLGLLGLFAILMNSSVSFGQTTIASEGFNNTSTLFSVSGGSYFTGSSASTDRPASSPFAVEGTHSYGVINSTATLTSSNINTSAYSSISMTLRVAAFSVTGSTNGLDNNDFVTVEVSPDGGTNYYSTVRVGGNSNAYWAYSTGTGNASTAYDGNATPVDFFAAAGGGNQTTNGYSTITVTGLPAVSSLKIRITLLNNATAEQWNVDDFKLTGTAAITSAQSGNWSSTSTWTGGVVPGSASNVIIAAGHVVTLDTATGGINTRNSGTTTTVDVGGTLATSVQYINNGTTNINGSFQLNAGGFTNSGNNFVYGSAGKLVFNNTSSYGVNNTDQYWPTTSGPVDVTILQGGMTLNSGANRTVTGVFQTAAAITLTSATLTLNGTVRINTGGSFANSPTYGSASTLVYNTGSSYGRGNEWTTATSGAGYPANVQISNPGTVTTLNMGTSSAQCSGSITVDASTILNTTSGGLTVLGSVTTNGTTNTGGALNVTGTVTTNGTISLGGDVTLSGTTASDWVVGASATQTNNGKAVFFTGASGTQNITKTGGGNIFFDYLVINKAAGSVVLSSSPATTVTINTTVGDVLQILNAGTLDLNGRTLTLNNAGGSIAANASGRSITSGVTGATLAITGSKSVSGAGTLVINTNVTTVLSAGFDFGVGKVTVNGTLQLNSGGFATNGSAPTYASGSTLLFNTGGFYDVHNGSADVAGWFRNVASTGSAQAGVPWNVTISNNTSVRYNTANNDVFPRYINGNLIINSGSALTLGGLSGTAGDFFLRGNWTNSGTFTPNSRLVSFNGTAAQTLTGATTFDYLTLNNSTGLTLSNNVTVNQTLTLTSGKITLGANTLTIASTGSVSGASTTNYIVAASTGQLKRTVGATATTFDVGNTAYNPITFTNSGTSDVYGVRVVETAPAGANNTKTVTRQWITTEAVAGGSTLTVAAQYNTGETGSGFATATDFFIGHYNGTAYSQQAAATQSGANPFVVTASATLSPSDLTTGTQYFAIGKDNGLLSVPSKYVVTAITPSSPTAGSGFSATITAQDNYGGTATLAASSTFALTSNGNAGAISGTTTGTIASAASSVTVSGIVLATAGTGVTLTATNTSGLSLTAGTSATFTVLAKASQLAFVGVPSTGNVGVNLTSFTVEARRPDNSLDNTYTGSVTIAKATGSGALSGTLTVSAVAGVATFSAAQFDTADTYTLTATSGSLTSATSGNIVITLAPVALGTYAFTGTASASGPAARLLASSVASNVTFSSYGRNTLTINAASGADDNVFSVQPSAGNYGTAINTALYEEFTVTPAVGYYLNLGSITFSIGRTGAGATNYIVRSNQDNYTADISTGTIPTTAAARTVTLSGTSNNAVTYRIYLYGGSSTGFVRIDDVTFNGNAICIQPTAYAVTGGGAYCTGGSGVSVGLANSQTGINYQLKRNGSTNVGSPVAGTGSALNFGLQTTAGTYTVVASNTNGTCNLTQTMTGSVSVAVNPLPTATIGGSTSVCRNATSPNITFTGGAGTAPYTFTYTLNGGSNQTISTTSGNSVTLSVPTTAAGTFVYALVSVADANCSQSQSGSATVTVLASPTAAVISGGASICSGSSTNLQVAITGGTSPYTVVYTGGTLSSYVSGTNISVSPSSTTTFTITSVTDANGCAGTGNSGSATVTLTTTTSTDGGATWSNGAPSATSSVVYDGSTGTIGANMTACSLRLTNNATVSVTSGFNVTLSGALTVDSGSTFTLNNNANLLQTGTATNSGNIVVKRNSAALKRLDYTLWSSPVTGQGLYAFSPFTFANRFYVYSPTSDIYVGAGLSVTGTNGDGVNGTDGNNVQFANATGYLIRTPWDHPTAPTVWTGTFTGVPNNGTVTRSGLTSGLFYAVGNPYPSTISADQFISDNNIGNNSSTPGDGLYFWRKTNNALASSYATYTTAGGVKSGGDTLNIVPNGIIQVGEGFIVKTTSTSLSFNNGQRLANNADQFLRTANVERNRIWLNLTDTNSDVVNQMMVSYMTGATQGIDAAIDGRYFNDNTTALNSLVNNEEFAIQGRSLPFDASDVVPLAFKSAAAGNFSIALDHVDGLFAGGAQTVYLKDNLTSTEHDLSTGAYTFATEAGTFNNRFELIYQSQLGVVNPGFTATSVIIYRQNNDFVVNTGTVVMASVKVFDIRGRLLQEKKGINATQTTINGGLANEVLLVQITSEDGAVVTKKVVR